MNKCYWNFCSLKQVCISSPSLPEPVSIFLILTSCFFGGMMANFDINLFIIALENSCKIGRAPYTFRLISFNAGQAPYDIVRFPAGHRPRLSYTDAGRHPYEMWPRKKKILKIVRCPGNYQIHRWFANRWNRMMSVLFVTIALAINTVAKTIYFNFAFRMLILPVSSLYTHNYNSS